MKKGILLFVLIFIIVGCSREETVVERKFEREPEALVKEEQRAPEKQMNVVREKLEVVEKKEEIAPKIIEKKEVKQVQEVNIPVKKEFKTKVTSIKKDFDTYQIELNEMIIIKDIRFEDGKMIFPYSTGRDERRYYFIWISDFELLKILTDAVTNNKIGKYEGLPEVTGIKISKMDRGVLKGFAEVEIDGEFIIKSIPVFIGGRFGDGIGKPSLKIGDEYIDMVFFRDKQWEKELEKLILKEYYGSQ